MLHALTVNDLVVDYTVYGDKAFADTNEADQVVADLPFGLKRILGLHILLWQ